MSLKQLFIHLLFLLQTHLCWSQTLQIDAVFENPNLQNYTMKKGLPSNFCNRIIQDKKGFIWIATQNGLSRFDGKHYLYLQEQSPNKKYQIPSNWVTDITEDHEGNIWINTNEGICKYDNTQDKIISYKKIIRGWGKICFVKPNKIYVSAWSGIDEYDINKDSLVFIKNYIETANNSIFSLSTIHNKAYATPEDKPTLIEIKNNSINYLKNIKHNNQVIVLNSVSSANNALYFNSRNSGLLTYQLQTKQIASIFETQLEKTKNITTSVFYKLNADSFLIVGTNGKGVYIINIKTLKTYHFTHNDFDLNSLCSNVITSVIVDSNNGIWLGTDMGISYFHPSLQKIKTHYFYNNPVITKNALFNCIKKVSQTILLIGTNNDGLFLCDHQEKKTIQLLSKLSVSAIEKITSEDYLIGTDQGIYRYDLKTIHKSDIDEITSCKNIFNLKKINDSLLGICTQKGFKLYNLKKKSLIFEEKCYNENSSHYIIKDALIDKNGMIWVLRFFNGYYILDPKTKLIKNITPSAIQNKPIDYHNIILSRDKNSVFISSSSGIIEHKINNLNSFKIYTSKNGLAGNTIENICNGPENNLYYSTAVELCSYSTKLEKSKLIYSYENYAQKWFNQLSYSDDSILISSISNYYISYSPKINLKNKTKSTILVNKILINKSEINFNTKVQLNLKHNQNNIDIELSTCNYIEPEKTNIHFRLDSDTSWSITNSGTISFTNLAPNNYTLFYYETNNEGSKISDVNTLSFSISNPFYKSWWFICILFLFILITTYILFIIRKKSQQKVKFIRQQISRNLHDELGANVSSINILTQLIKNSHDSNDSVKPFLEKLSSNSNQISQTINDIIWNVNPKFDNLESLINRITRYTSDMFDKSDIKYSININLHTQNIKLSNEIKYNIYLICKEAINNISKYSKSTLTTLNLSSTSDYILISIEDNGIGFNDEAYEVGNGLNNMLFRAKLIQSEFTIKSELNKGTHIQLKIKL